MAIQRKKLNKIKVPIWFFKLKKATPELTDASIIILLAIGYTEHSLLILILRVGLSALLKFTEIILTDESETNA